MSKAPTAAAILATLTLFVPHAFSQPRARGFIGLALTDASGPAGALVGMVTSQGPAEKAGVKRGDLIVSINGVPVDQASTMTRMIGSMAPNQVAHINVIRGSGTAAQRQTIDVVVGSADGTGISGTSTPIPTVPPRTNSDPNPGTSTNGAPSRPLAMSGFTRVTDPLEQAFTVEVPSGWRSEVGLARRAALQINPYVRSLSPDKMVYLMAGEPTMPSFTPPSQMTNAIGHPEGTLYDAGLGGVALMLHYMAGPEFSRLYGETVLRGLCPSFKFQSTRQRPDLARKAEALVPTVIPSRADGGEARFLCMHNGQAMEARVEAVTRITQDNIGWAAIYLQAFLAPQGQGEKTEELLNRIVGSFQYSDAWTRKQNSLSQEAARQINLRMQDIFRQQQAFMQKLNSVDETFESMDELVSGFSTYHDDKTGNNYSLSNTNPNKWIDDSTGRIFNSRPPWAPSLRQLPHSGR